MKRRTQASQAAVGQEVGRPGSSGLWGRKQGSVSESKAMEKDHILTSSSRYTAYLR